MDVGDDVSDPLGQTGDGLWERCGHRTPTRADLSISMHNSASFWPTLSCSSRAMWRRSDSWTAIRRLERIAFSRSFEADYRVTLAQRTFSAAESSQRSRQHRASCLHVALRIRISMQVTRVVRPIKPSHRKGWPTRPELAVSFLHTAESPSGGVGKSVWASRIVFSTSTYGSTTPQWGRSRPLDEAFTADVTDFDLRHHHVRMSVSIAPVAATMESGGSERCRTRSRARMPVPVPDRLRRLTRMQARSHRSHRKDRAALLIPTRAGFLVAPTAHRHVDL